MTKKYILFALTFYLLSGALNFVSPQEKPKVSLVVLGTVQDAGSPHTGCAKACCKNLFLHPDAKRMVVSLGIVDHENKLSWMFEATPDLPRQMKALKNFADFGTQETPNGIFLTHAHIGHYTGLMFLGKESMNSKDVPIYSMPRMKSFLEQNGPWSQLVALNNIRLKPIKQDKEIMLSSNVKVKPIRVPHRDEFSETVGYIISGPSKKVMFIPDIDKWERWDKKIVEQIKNVDYAFLDASFYDSDEIKNRDISEIPHPFVIESLKLFENLPAVDKSKIYFIHFNHTNPLLNPESEQTRTVLNLGFKIARMSQIIKL